jgi:hypothetical protein
MGETINFKSKLYEFNKTQMSQVLPLDEDWFNKKCEEVANTIVEDGGKYWMLLCRERFDFTIFHLLYTDETKEKLASDLKETLLNRGHIIDFTKQLDNNYEIWIRDFDTKENFVYYLFNYELGVEEV